ncbi:MAG: DnaD domain protein [Clostridia bacterium]|nr:DnaD domain protein [Clostridia bacterium]
MKFTINTTVFGNTFAVPSVVADKYLKIATHTQIKVLLYFMRNISDGIEPQKISEALSLPVTEVEDALLFWQQRDILVGEKEKEPEKKNVIINSTMPTRADVIKRGLEDKQLMFLLREAQLKFGRNLKQNESQLLVSLYDDHGMDPSVILLLLQYAVREGKCNISFVKKIATHWLNQGVQTVVDAERLITEQTKQNLAWSIVQNVFGIERRNPSAKELELSNLWINEWQISKDLLKAAYDACIDAKTKLSMPYVAKIIESWHKDGITSPEMVTAKKQNVGDGASTSRKNKTDYAGYDLDLFEKMMKEKMKGKGL